MGSREHRAVPTLDPEDDRTDDENITMDAVFVDHIGEFAVGQRFYFCVVNLAWLPGAMMTLNMSFTGKDPIVEHLWRCVDPQDQKCADAYAQSDPTAEFCGLDPAAWAWTAALESVVSDFGLFCSKAWLMQFANSAFFLGFFLGASFWGAISDWYGRKPALIWSCASSAILGLLSAAAPGYILYFLARIGCGAAVAGPGLVAFTHGSEIVGPSFRGVIGIATQFFWSVGCCLLPAIALLLPAWRALTAVSALAMAAMLVLLIPLMPESPRWLLSQGRRSESFEVLASIAKRNGAVMPDKELRGHAVGEGPQPTLWDTFRVPVLRKRQCILLTSWCGVSLAYYGVSLALDSLGGSLYLNFLIVSLMELLAYVIAVGLINRWGRKALTVTAFAISGASCLGCAALQRSDSSTLTALRTATAVGGKFGASIAFILLFVYTSELFPTVVRNVALGSNSSAARAGGVLAPLTVLLAQQWDVHFLPFLIFGVVTLVAGLMCTVLPETLGRQLPDSIEDVQKQRSHAIGELRPLAGEGAEPSFSSSSLQVAMEQAA